MKNLWCLGLFFLLFGCVSVPAMRDEIFYSKTSGAVRGLDFCSASSVTNVQDVSFPDMYLESFATSSPAVGVSFKINIQGDISLKDLFQMLLQGSEKQYVISAPDSSVSVYIDGSFTGLECSNILRTICEINSVRYVEKGSVIYVTKTEKDDKIGCSVFTYKFKNIVLDKLMIEHLKEKRSNVQIINNTVLLVGTDTEVLLMRDIVSSIDVDVFSGFHLVVITTRNADDYVKAVNDMFSGLAINTTGVMSIIRLSSSLVAVVSRNEEYLQKLQKISNLIVSSVQKFRHVVPVRYRSSSEMLEAVQKVYKVDMVSDDMNNRLLVLSNDDDHSKVLDIVNILDVKPKQVSYKLYLVDVKSTKISDSGLDVLFGSGNFQVSNLNVTKGLGGLTAVGNVGNLQSFFTLLEKNFDAKVVSKPSVCVQSGQECKVRFATSVPYITSISNVANGQPSGGLVQNVSYRDVGIIITIKGVVNENNEIMLGVYVENSTLGAKQGVQDNPVFTTDSVDTMFNVRSHQVAILGGLKSTSHQQNRKGIPLLNRLDYVGNLFGFHDSQDDKREMMVFVCPEVLGSDDMDEIGMKLLNNYKTFLN